MGCFSVTLIDALNALYVVKKKTQLAVCCPSVIAKGQHIEGGLPACQSACTPTNCLSRTVSALAVFRKRGSETAAG